VRFYRRSDGSRGCVLAVLALSARATLAKGELTARRVLELARLQSPSLGVAAIQSVVACGTYCKSYTPHVFVTGDAHSWRDIAPPHLLLEVEEAVFSTPRVGWFAANDCSAGRAFFYRTGNGGRSWRRTAAPPTNCAAGSRLDVSFADTRDGWILLVAENGNRVGLYRTRDGGKAWRRVDEDAPLKGAIAFATPRIGWLARSDFPLPGELYWTGDAGRSWHRRRLRLPRGWRGAKPFPDRPTFFGARGVLPVDLAGGRQSAVAFYTTGNDGGTWRLRAVHLVDFPILARSSEGGPVWYVPTSIATPSTWWIVGGRRDGHVAVTSDAGDSWQVAAAPVVGSEISAVDARRAWLNTTGRKGALYATSNGGRTWRQLTLP
jgi:photosystem II stability/assembly factor-like uncharacterized protein